jgi:hypothetical protein
MAKEEKDRQHNGQRRKGQTTQWPKKKRTDNTMAKEEKDRQHNGQRRKGQTTQWPKKKRTTGQTTIYKTPHIKLKIE